MGAGLSGPAVARSPSRGAADTPVCVPAQGDMDSCLAAVVLNAVDRRSLQRSARLGQEVLERARRRAVDWHSSDRPGGSVGVLSREPPCPERWPAPDLHRLPREREEKYPTLSASFRTMAEFMDYTSSQCGRYYSTVLEEGGASHVYRYHRRELLEPHRDSDVGHSQENYREKTSIGPGSSCQTSESAQEASWPDDNSSKDLYIEVYPGTYSVTVGSNALTRKTHVVAVDSGQSVDLIFPV